MISLKFLTCPAQSSPFQDLVTRHAPATHREVGALSAPGSVVFHDACSAGYLNAGVVVGGAPFIGGSDQSHAHAPEDVLPLAFHTLFPTLLAVST